MTPVGRETRTSSRRPGARKDNAGDVVPGRKEAVGGPGCQWDPVFDPVVRCEQFDRFGRPVGRGDVEAEVDAFRRESGRRAAAPGGFGVTGQLSSHGHSRRRGLRCGTSRSGAGVDGVFRALEVLDGAVKPRPAPVDEPDSRFEIDRVIVDPDTDEVTPGGEDRLGPRARGEEAGEEQRQREPERGHALEAVPEVGAEAIDQSAQVGGRAQLAEEEAEQLGFLDEREAAHEIAVAVQPDDAVDGVLDLGEGEHAPGQGQAEEFHVGQGLPSLVVPLFRDGPALHPADAADEVEGGGEGAGRVLGLGHVGEEAAGVEVTSQPPGGVMTGTPTRSSSVTM